MLIINNNNNTPFLFIFSALHIILHHTIPNHTLHYSNLKSYTVPGRTLSNTGENSASTLSIYFLVSTSSVHHWDSIFIALVKLLFPPLYLNYWMTLQLTISPNKDQHKKKEKPNPTLFHPFTSEPISFPRVTLLSFPSCLSSLAEWAERITFASLYWDQWNKLERD